MNAIVILAHGSRVADAAKDMERVAHGIQSRRPGTPVRVAFMELCPPDLPSTIDALVDQGASRVLVMPYFLHVGNHILRDIPGILESVASKHPSVELVLGSTLGFDECMVDLVDRRIDQSDRRASNASARKGSIA